MASENETIAEIVKEIRQTGPYTIYRKPIFREPSAFSEEYVKRFLYGQMVTDFGMIRVENPKIKDVSNYELADRIEAAHRREVTELRECLRLSSNSMEMVVQWLGKYPKWQDELKYLVAENRKALEGAKDDRG